MNIEQARFNMVENLLIQNLPGPDLLFDHVEARLLDVHWGLRRLNISTG
jgi:hypothetical protein